MTTPTPTSESGGVGALPDLASLTALANELFQQLPNGAPATNLVPAAPTRPVSFGTPPAPSVPTLGAANFTPNATSLPITPPLPVSQSAAAQHLAPPSLITPRVAPTQAQTPDVHAASATTAPMLGRSASVTQGVPEAVAAQAPVVAPIPGLADSAIPLGATPPGAAPSTPYYFIGESSAYPSQAAPNSDAPSARSYALPGNEALSRTPTVPEAPPATAPVSGASAPSYYFTDLAPPAAHDARRADAVPSLPASRGAFDVHAVRKDFPILRERVNGRPLIWFDNAATTQKPQAVIDRLAYFYAHENSNIHRAAHELAARATDAYEGARAKVARFLGARSTEEIIFVRGATEGVNLVAAAWGRQNIGENDEIVVSHLEHHANIVPWQMLAAEKGAKLRVIPVDDSGQLRLDELQKLLNSRTKLVAVTQVSNALGTVVPVQQVVEMAHRAGAKVLVDGAQAVSHLRVNLQTLDADFYVFSGHKIFAPTGIGVVYGKRELLEQMAPYQGGGNMIEDVTFEQTRYHGPPMRFEAGTGNIADAVGLGAALDYVERIGLEAIARYEHELLEYGTACLKTIPGLRLIGTARDKTSVMSFTLAGYETHEVGKALNEEGIAVRTGHHCAQPILRRFGVEATVRPSVAFYNTFDEIDVMIAVLRRLAARR